MISFSRLPFIFLTITCGISTGEEAVDFSRDIRPILSGKCFKCHGPDSGSREADLRLDLRDAALDAEAIIAGAAHESSLFDRVTTGDLDDRMPPKGKPLSQEEVRLLRIWIDAGAPYENHWAYEKPVPTDLPSGSTHPIDHFVRARLEEKGLRPAPPADPAVLLRRLSLDLIGIPPTIEEVSRFERDPSEACYEREVDRLLASNHFGEKWARHWLDLARYADSNGYQHDDLRTMWPYRDWVINALNEDMPFDRFTIEQLAGDLLPNPSREQLVATGFHRNVATNFSGGSKVRELRADILHDRVSTTGQVWLAMTMECSQCHDHKFDPIPQRDYYELYAYFNQAVTEFAMEGPGMFRKKFIGADLPFVGSRIDKRRVEEISDTIELVAAKLEEAKATALADQVKWEREFLDSDRGANIPWKRFPWNLRGGLNHLRIPPAKRTDDEKLNVEALLFYDHPATGPHERTLDRLKEERDDLVARTMVMKDEKEMVPTNLFLRGDYTSLGEHVEPGVPDVLHPLDPGLPPNRLGLAQWIVDPENPLTARVTVNRFWAEIFGRGIVTTPEDFGMQSPSPTHPELLDWLALEFIRQDWSMKQLIKTIVMSETYRQTATACAEKMAQDPANEWLARGPRFRLSAELIRDNLLAISGRLSRKIGGPAVYPPQPEGLWKEISGADVSHYPTSEGEDRQRRGLYTFLRRGNPNPMVLNFDGSGRSACVTSRDRSNTPVQALNLLNDPCYVEAAQAFAAWIEGVPGDDFSKATAAFRRAVARQPSEAERQALVALYEKHGSWFSVAQVILNLDETLTKS
ncbi:MAG: PSD1 and planctomycete cytochrome C domain-containing protein [Verrucomicrobiota bacterium]